MGSSIQARLDEKSLKTFESLTKQLGWSPSKIIREGLQLLAACHIGDGRKRIVGMGKFESGKPDLGSNKKHLRDFGK
jgi:hypothetical protein